MRPLRTKLKKIIQRLQSTTLTVTIHTLLKPTLEKEFLYAILAFAILPNIIFAFPATGIAIQKSYFSYDFLLLGIFVYFLRPSVAVTIYTALTAVSFFSITAHVFHFNLDELIYASGNTNQLAFDPNLIPFFPLLAFFLFYGTGGYLAWKSARRHCSVHAIIMAVITIGLAFLDHANGSLCANAPDFIGNLLPSTSQLSSCDHLSSPVNFVRSDSKVLISSIYGAFRDAGRPTVWIKEPSAIQIALNKQITAVRSSDLRNENLVLILVESWGDTPHRPDVQRTILAPILTPRLTARYTLQRGTVPFHGSTTHAELRELCGIDGNFRKINSRNTQHCLPEVLAKDGYAVHGYHGFSYDMFARNRWWPLIGIPQQNMHFMEQIEPQHPNRKCGMAFRGICDADIIADTQSVLRSRQKTFVYILTLNSHLPITIDDKDLARIPCQRLKLDESQCALAVSWHIVMSAVAKLAGSSINSTRFVVVGDHAPPLWSSASAGLFDQKLVPYFILTPRS